MLLSIKIARAARSQRRPLRDTGRQRVLGDATEGTTGTEELCAMIKERESALQRKDETIKLELKGRG
jgi:hypothetical protein